MFQSVFLLSSLLIVNFFWSINGETGNEITTCEDKNSISDDYIISNVNAQYKKGYTSNIFYWLDSCQKIENKITGLNVLYQAIVNNGSDNINNWTIKFANVLEKNIMPQVSDATGIKLEKKYLDLLLDLYYILPKCVINLVSHEDIFIENQRYEEYLIASEMQENGASSSRNVFFANMTKKIFNQSKWNIEIVENEKSATFLLKNVHFEVGTLFASGLTNGYGDHILYTSEYSFPRLSQWILEPVDEFGTACLLRNIKWNEHLCAYDQKFYKWSHYRRVFTTSTRSVADTSCHFKFITF